MRAAGLLVMLLLVRERFAKIASIIKKIKTETVKTQTTHARLRSFLLRQKTKRKKKKKKCSQRKKTFPPSLV
jgi:hypothetical protein